MKTTLIAAVFLLFACIIAIEARRIVDDPKDLELLRREWIFRKRLEDLYVSIRFM